MILHRKMENEWKDIMYRMIYMEKTIKIVISGVNVTYDII